MKVYREWRISGDVCWVAKMFPMVQRSLDFCIETWDQKQKGLLKNRITIRMI